MPNMALHSYPPIYTYLTLGPDTDVADHGAVWTSCCWLLDTEVGECVLPEDGPGVQVGCHEATVTTQSLKTRERHGEDGRKDKLKNIFLNGASPVLSRKTKIQI